MIIFNCSNIILNQKLYYTTANTKRTMVQRSHQHRSTRNVNLGKRGSFSRKFLPPYHFIGSKTSAEGSGATTSINLIAFVSIISSPRP